MRIPTEFGLVGAMHDGWFYADGEKPVGPVTIDVLNAVLATKSDPGKVKVWRAGFADWRETQDVPQLASQILQPPPLQPPPLKPAPAPIEKLQHGTGDDDKT